MTDNFDLIRSLLSFPSEDTFYFLQIIARRKDNPTMEKGEKLIRNYYIYSLEDFDKLKPHIIEHCEKNNARAYFRLNKRSAKLCAMQSLKRITDLIIQEQYRDVNDIYPSIAGEYHADEDKKWLIDIDENTDLMALKFKNWRFKNNPKSDTEDKIDIVAEIPTVSGLHLIVRPFRLDAFMKDFGGKDMIHKDNPTILYFAGK